jgi:hypothetical protein
MNSEQWIENLAQRARKELAPDLVGEISTDAIRRRLLERSATPPIVPQKAMWLSGAASLLAACVLLTMGMRMQSSSTTTSDQTQPHSSISALFSPLNTDSQ